MNWQGQKVLVTGAGGFIGSHLAEALAARGASVRALVLYDSLGARGWLDHCPAAEGMEIVAGDITDFDGVRQAVRDCQVVFHLAALIAIPYSYQAPRSYVRTNVEGTLNVLQACRECGVGRLVHTSTSEVYGTARRVPIDEEHPLQGQSPYAASKIAADKLAESFHHAFGLPVVTVRPFNTYGPRQSARAVIPTIITQVLRGQEVRLGNLSPTRDFNFVADTVAGFLALAACDAAVGRTVNLGSGREISIGETARLILELMGKDARLATEEQRLRPAGSEVERLCADNRQARQLCGWSPATPLRQGLQQTIAWLEKNLGLYAPGIYAV